MNEKSQEVLNCIKVFALYFSPITLDRFVSFTKVRLGWSAQKIVTHVDALIEDNKLTIEGHFITII